MREDHCGMQVLNSYDCTIKTGTESKLSAPVFSYNMMIPGSKGHKSDASLLAGGFLNLGPAKNMSKKPFFEEK